MSGGRRQQGVIIDDGSSPWRRRNKRPKEPSGWETGGRYAPYNDLANGLVTARTTGMPDGRCGRLLEDNQPELHHIPSHHYVPTHTPINIMGKANGEPYYNDRVP